MKKFPLIYGFLSRNKYLITTVVGVVIVGFADQNSIYRRMVLYYEILDLRSEIEKYDKAYREDSQQLRALERNPRNIERIARERYFMKADNEDIYVLSTDPVSDTNGQTEEKDDTTE